MEYTLDCIGEIQALTWENVDFQEGFIRVRRSYVRRERTFKEYPKGRNWHNVPIPPELREILYQERKKFLGGFVATGPEPRSKEGRPLLNYESYLKALKVYGRELGLKEVAIHGLRHSTAGLWMDNGAAGHDMEMLFDHSDKKVTERYIHNDTTRKLKKFSDVIRLFPEWELSDKNSSSQNLPNLENLEEVLEGKTSNA